MSSFKLRGLELHSSRMWRWASVERSLDVMGKIGLNALIFHQNDLVDQLVFPEKYFSVADMWKSWPVRMHTIFNNRQYIRKVIGEAKNRGIGFYLEVKEIYYPEGLLELNPELRQSDGSICASNPFWWEFIEAKIQELLEEVPDIAGMIVSPASRESKVSISNNDCHCARCQAMEPSEWYHRLLDSMYRPLQEKGKTLAVRDFSYTAAHQDMAINAASLCSQDIVIALKNTPHDFYPTFPSNNRIGHTHGHPQWVEFDTWGQFFGIGFFPCSVVEDMKQRIDFCQERCVDGVWFRSDWEVMTEASSFNSFNLLNVFAGGMLARDPGTPLDEIYRTWASFGLFSPLKPESVFVSPLPISKENDLQKLKKFMIASWSVIEKTVYVRGHVFHEDMMFHQSLQLAFEMMTEIHGRDQWDPNASQLVEPTAANTRIILEEKRAALNEVAQLPSILQPRSLDIPDEFAAELETMLELYHYLVEGYYYSAGACFLAKKTLQTRNLADLTEANGYLNELINYRERLIQRLNGTAYPHYVYWLLDTDRLQKLIDSIRRNLETIEWVLK